MRVGHPWNRRSVSRLPRSTTANSGLNFGSESNQATDFKLNIHSSEGRVSQQAHQLHRWEKRVNESLSSWSGKRMANGSPQAYESASTAFSCLEHKNAKKYLYKLG